MKFDFDEFKSEIPEIVREVIDESVNDAKAFWESLTANETVEAEHALRRLAENNLNALRFPTQAEEYHKSAAHNLNTLLNLAAGSQIAIRNQARLTMNRLFDRIIEAGFTAIDVFL